VIVGWAGALAGLFAIDPGLGAPLVTLEVAVTIVAGALLDRWWAFLVPLVATVVLFAVRYALDPGCSDCREDSYDVQIVLTLILIDVPACAAMTIGVGARRAARRRRGAAGDAETA
jgi:hypothetical protein